MENAPKTDYSVSFMNVIFPENGYTYLGYQHTESDGDNRNHEYECGTMRIIPFKDNKTGSN